jgi:hypothetical protein
LPSDKLQEAQHLTVVSPVRLLADLLADRQTLEGMRPGLIDIAH